MEVKVRMKVIAREQRPLSSAAGAFQRSVGVSAEVTGAEQLWSAEVELAPGAVSLPHHHAECESSIYLIEGEARFYAGDDLHQRVDAKAGDFIWVPAHEVHVEQPLADASAAHDRHPNASGCRRRGAGARRLGPRRGFNLGAAP